MEGPAYAACSSRLRKLRRGSSLIGTGVVSDGARSVVLSLYGSDGRRRRWIFMVVVHAV